jgi:hypothetical protein
MDSTWDLVSDSYKYGERPAVYDHNDDFDSIMAAAHLLSADGAEYALNGAAYDYYGHLCGGSRLNDYVNDHAQPSESLLHLG